MNKVFFSRLLQILLVLACLSAPILTVIAAARLGRVLMDVYVDRLAGHPLPALTRAIFGLAIYPPWFVLLSGIVLMIILIAAAFWLARPASTTDGASVKLLLLVSAVWAGSMYALAGVVFAFTLPMFHSEEVSLDGSGVGPLLKAAAAVDRTALGFTALPTDGYAHLEIWPGANGNARLHIYGAPERILLFRPGPQGYRWIAEEEIYSGPKIWQTVAGDAREQLVVQYQLERVKDFPTNRTCIQYLGRDPRWASRAELRRKDIEPLIAQWKEARQD